MPLDFSNEEEQREFVPGPVPGGSIVVLSMHIMEPNPEQQARDDRHIFVSKNGLRQLYCKFVVDRGTYQGVQFRQNITLPVGQQTIDLSEGQRKACNIGGAQLKAICLASKRPTKLRDVMELDGLKFPARLTINDRPTQKDDGRVFWNNRISYILTPDKDSYAQVRRDGEIIMKNGPVTGNDTSFSNAGQDNSSNTGFDSSPEYNDTSYMDDIPF